MTNTNLVAPARKAAKAIALARPLPADDFRLGRTRAAAEPLLQGYLWHGTTTKNAESILREGLDPLRTAAPHRTCFADTAQQALFWSRIHGELQRAYSSDRFVDAVLIRVPAWLLDPAAIAAEENSAHKGCYGSSVAGRQRRANDALAAWEDESDWRPMLRACGAVATSERLAVDPSWIRTPPENTALRIGTNTIVHEVGTGVACPWAAEWAQRLEEEAENDLLAIGAFAALGDPAQHATAQPAFA